MSRRASAQSVAQSPQREQALRVRLEPTPDGLRAVLTGAQQSHILTSMLGADALAFVPLGKRRLAAGDPVEIERL